MAAAKQFGGYTSIGVELFKLGDFRGNDEYTGLWWAPRGNRDMRLTERGREVANAAIAKSDSGREKVMLKMPIFRDYARVGSRVRVLSAIENFCSNVFEVDDLNDPPPNIQIAYMTRDKRFFGNLSAPFTSVPEGEYTIFGLFSSSALDRRD